MSRLVCPEFFALMGLRRVRRGGIARIGDHYVDSGVQIPGCLLPVVFGGLVEDGLVVVAAPATAAASAPGHRQPFRRRVGRW